MIQWKLNGKEKTFSGDPTMPLLWVIREGEALTGTKYACGMAQCGACTIHIDGEPVRSCVLPVSAVANKSVTTVEGLTGPVAEAVQKAWSMASVPQCGYCQSGQIMSTTALLEKNKKPTDADIDAALDGNICRCGTYSRIRAAIHSAAKSLT
jgi:isoquinoline 1-oxidoreductase subunit alpha